MSIVLVGMLAFLGLVGLQGLIWTLVRERPDGDVNEYVRDLGCGRAVLSFFEHDGVSHVRAALDFAGAAEDMPRLELARRGAAPVLAKWVGAVSEHPLADETLAARFVCRAPESPRAFEALGRMKARLLEGGEPWRLCELRLDRRSLAIVVAGVGRGDIEGVGELLDGLARAVLGPGGVTVRGEDALRARCGFCHADLASEDLAAVACDACSTVVHELCWKEHGGRCPVLGCRGHSPVRIEAPARR